jgi:hypothetical protein
MGASRAEAVPVLASRGGFGLHTTTFAGDTENAVATASRIQVV